MSLILITGDKPVHRYVANQIVRSHSVAAILVVEATPGRSWKQVLSKSIVQFIDKAFRKIYLSAIGDAAVRDSTFDKVLGLDSKSFLCPELIVRVGYPKGKELLEKVSQITPSIIAVYGTEIIPDTVLSQAKSVSLNMHTGISPWYRGVSCYHWPLINGETDKIGATIHECTSKVDGGHIFYTAKADVFKGDNIHTIFARVVMVGAKGYVEVIEKALSDELTDTP